MSLSLCYDNIFIIYLLFLEVVDTFLSCFEAILPKMNKQTSLLAQLGTDVFLLKGGRMRESGGGRWLEERGG